MKNNTIFTKSMRFALLSIMFLLFFVSTVQSRDSKAKAKVSKVQVKVSKEPIKTVTFDTIVTDTNYIITQTTIEQSTTIDSVSNQNQFNLAANNPLDANNLKKTQEGKAEIDSAMAELHEGMDFSARMFDVMVSSMDSAVLKIFVDSILTVSSGDLKTAIGKMNKYIQANNSSSILNGLKVVVKLVHFEMNGKKVGASELDPLFVKSVTMEDLKQTKANFMVIKEKIERLKSEPAGKIAASEMFNQCQALFKDPLVIRLFENVMTQAQNTKYTKTTNTKTLTTKVTYTAPKDH